MSTQPGVLIIGGGLAGLCCALRLHQSGLSFQILEASDGVGGRVRTDTVEGFLLDHGFQVLLTAYPEARSVLDYDALNLRPFYPGAQVKAAFRMSAVNQDAVMPIAIKAIAPSRVYVVQFRPVNRPEAADLSSLSVESEAIYDLIPPVPGVGK